MGQDCGGSELSVVFSAGSQCHVFRYSTECLEKQVVDDYMGYI